MDVALADLQPRDRNMLRQHVVFGLALGEVARLNDVHRATVHRWLGTVRDQLRQRVRAELCRRLGVDDGDLSSIVRIVRSRLDLPL
jgi:RNA polymerase sigma-70 factor (ECF subfamily)